MSPICQSFVQNAWRKDLCSNCFKSQEEHGSRRLDYSSRSNYSTDCPATKRYVGVAGRSTVYGRNYYGKSGWNPLMLEDSMKESRSLKSPGLIKGMDSIIKQENEKNRTTDLDGQCEDSEDMEVKPIPKPSITNDSWIISQIIADTREYNSKSRLSDRLQGDSSSDLGSDASNDTSRSSASGCSGHYDFRDPDDMYSGGSEPDSAHDEEERGYSPTQDNEFLDEVEDEADNRKVSVMSEPSISVKPISTIHSILKQTKSLPLCRTTSVSFNESNQVIGYGGDIDYSDDDAEDYDDNETEDDDDDSISSSDLTAEERALKYLTEKNTNLNSEDLDQLPSNVNSEFVKEEPNFDPKQDVKVKLKRSQPIIGMKPQIKPQLSLSSEEESTPMKGIKPKFVSREEEMKENSFFEQHYEKTDKVTSIDDTLSTLPVVDVKVPKITSFDDRASSYLESKSSTTKVTSFNSEPSEGIEKATDKVSKTQANDPCVLPEKTVATENDCEKIPEIDYDYTVKSAEVTMHQPSISKRIQQQKSQRNIMMEIENSKENLEKVRSAVIPLNIINIQRRNSFMESQLSGSVYDPVETLNSESEIKKEKELITKKPQDIVLQTPKSTEVEKIQKCKPNIVAKPIDNSNKVENTQLSINDQSKKGLSSFGALTASKGPQSSFLHSGQVKPASDTVRVNSIIYSTPDFVKEIHSKPNAPPITAGIQKSAIYASSSILKGVPGPKPATTPKPKLPPKTRIISSRVVGTPISKASAISTPNLSSINSSENIHPKVAVSNSSECLLSDSNKHVSNNATCDANVYDVPVTVSLPTTSSTASPTSSTVSAPSPTSSSGYSSTSNMSTHDLHEAKLVNATVMSSSPQLQSKKLLKDDTQSQYRATFEANRNILSSNLNLCSETTKSKAPAEPQISNDQEKTNIIRQPISIERASYEEDNYPKPLISENLINKIHSYDQHSYVNLGPVTTHESPDLDSFSSFTDDFDDDDDDDDEDDDDQRTGHYEVNPEEKIQRRTAERSSSATPVYRNSVGPVNICPLNVGDAIEVTKLPAVRSHSAPRSIDHKVNPSAFAKAKDSSSKFSFVKSGFFRPSSPPSLSRKSLSERGRDRTKKSHSVFSLRKLLRLGSGGDKMSKVSKHSMTPKELEPDREVRKKNLQIIHPLDYNPNGVEVIARPEKRVPPFETSDMYGSANLETLTKSSGGNPFGTEPSPRNATSLISFTEPLKDKNSMKVPKKNSFLRKKKKTDRKDSERSDVRPVVTYVRRPSTSSSVSDSMNRNSTVAPNSSSAHLGYNSEGRPKPPPPPRKTSLETSPPHEVFFIATNPATYDSSSKGPQYESEHLMAPPNPPVEADSSSLSSNSSSTKPNRPPPPRRTPSVTSSTNSACPLGTKDFTLYANLGNARASFTPRKPGRSSSVREEEKRRAPHPPSATSEVTRVTKGPAPPAPVPSVDARNHDYEIIAGSTPEKLQQPSDHTCKNRGLTLNTFTLKDQYGAVTNSNLEVLSNILDQMSNETKSEIYDSVRSRVNRWSDLTLTSPHPISCGVRIFYPARSGTTDLTVMVTPETKLEEDSLLGPTPVVSFRDDLPSAFLHVRKPFKQQTSTQGSVWVLPPMVLSSLEDFGHRSIRVLQENPHEWQRQTCLFLLQMVTALKQLQAKGIEESSLDLVLVLDDFEGDSNPRLIMVPESHLNSSSGSSMSLCQCASATTQLLLGHSHPVESSMQGPVLSPPFVPSPHAFTSLVNTLREERASSLTRAKCILETMLFGPDNIRVSSEPNLDASLQKWLDLERANVLQSLLKEQTSGSLKLNFLLTKFRLMFLVRSNIKNLAEALRVLEAPDVTNF